MMRMENTVLDTLENGLLVANQDLEISFWNRWLELQTGISKQTAQKTSLSRLFPQTSFRILKRKIKIAFKIKSPTFTNAGIDQYVIPIELKKITKSIFRYMRQEVIITPIDSNHVSILIYDATPLLEANAIIDEQLKLVEKQAITDELTQCYNKTMFNKLLTLETKKAKRNNTLFCLIIFDIDDFKIVNDRFGHLEGDRVLKEMSFLSKKNIRESDIFARWGGEEFCILLPETDLNGAVRVAEKVRQMISLYDFGISGHHFCSFGISQYTAENTENDIVANADKALYHAKNNGKNKVAVFDNGNTVIRPKPEGV